MEDKTFAQTLKDLRKAKKMTLVELAEKANTSNSYLSQLENKRRNPPKPEMIKNISIGLGNNDQEEVAIYEKLMRSAGYDQSSIFENVESSKNLFEHILDYSYEIYQKYEKYFKEIYSPREVSRIKDSIQKYIFENYGDKRTITEENISMENNKLNIDMTISKGKGDQYFVKQVLFNYEVKIHQDKLSQEFEPSLNMLARSTNQNYNLFSYFIESTKIDDIKLKVFQQLISDSMIDIQNQSVDEIVTLNEETRNKLIDMSKKHEPIDKTNLSLID